ncbi:aspartate kinase [Candidatus Odyssella thessalonicensis]|uniref:aspartate kinase n=1 Tax=Candidatus Odyssella thessalonicensis TaxID=84647 RepID=UPI0002E3296D|nr:aspartate kinase [Candidatus Odyssella thessalonicensis]
MRIVMKFGGTSVADIGRLEHVAIKVRRQIEAGAQVAVVVSAMAGVTNQLVNYAKALGGGESSIEYDAVVATGEQITTALLALALQQIGVQARSFMGWQIPILTDDSHGQAQIQLIEPQALEDCWAKGIVPIIAGFQGVNSQGRITTLGRGGSDTTAVAVAAAVKADRCDIYTDVDGVYTADPRVVPLAQKLDHISYDEMLELAAQGAKVLHPRSVSTAMLAEVPVQVLSSFGDKPGTMVTSAGHLHHAGISGITHVNGWLKLTAEIQDNLHDTAQEIGEMLKSLAIPHDMMLLTMFNGGNIDLFIPHGHLTPVLAVLEQQQVDPQRHVVIATDLAKVTLVGRGLVAENGYSQKLMEIIKNLDFPTYLATLTPQKFSIGVQESQACILIRYLHYQFNLDQINDNSPKIMAAGL